MMRTIKSLEQNKNFEINKCSQHLCKVIIQKSELICFRRVGGLGQERCTVNYILQVVDSIEHKCVGLDEAHPNYHLPVYLHLCTVLYLYKTYIDKDQCMSYTSTVNNLELFMCYSIRISQVGKKLRNQLATSRQIILH